MTLPEILERIHQRLDAIEAKLAKQSKLEQKLERIGDLEETYRVDLPMPYDPDATNPDTYERRGI